jgi:UDP-N-acetylmuramoyl-tripeptide--D-alanyl-D-alanine ligase
MIIINKIRISQIAEIVNGKLISNNNVELDCVINGIKTDSRFNLNGCLFVPITGENFNGHDFIKQAIENGAVCSLSEYELNLEIPTIIVKSTLNALKKLAEYYRSLFDIQMIAITGSIGKTTTKDLIYSILSQKYKVLKTEGNFNNEIGLPLTIFNLNDEHEYAVIEMGMNHFGEIHNLSYIAKPNIAVITNIGISHLEHLGSREGIKKAKFEIFDFMKKNGQIVLNGDDDLLNNSNKENTNYFGIENNNDIFATNIIINELDSVEFTINYMDESFDVKINTPGKHMVVNVLCAALVGFLADLTKEQIKKGISDFKPSKMRMNVITTNKYTIINDVYNSSPDSVKAAIDALSYCSTRKIAILGDMLELGAASKKIHEEIGEYVSTKNIDIVICIGEFSKFTFDVFIKNGVKAFYFKNQDEVINSLENILSLNDTILVKASRGLGLEKTVLHIENN